MNKIWIISIVIVILLISMVSLLFLSSKSSTPPSNSTNVSTGLPVANSVGQTTTTNTPSASKNGTRTVQVKNFINNPTTAKDPINAGYYYLGYHMNEGVQDATATNTPPYIIEYIKATKYFNIALLQEPIGETRLAAEKFLMNDLGITQSEMCQLNYMVSVPDSVNSLFSSRNLGFSFCPGATVLPN